MDAVGNDLGKRAADISEYSLNASLDAATRASNAQYDDPDVMDRLRIRLDKAAGVETGVGVGVGMEWSGGEGSGVYAGVYWCRMVCTGVEWCMLVWSGVYWCRMVGGYTWVYNTIRDIKHAAHIHLPSISHIPPHQTLHTPHTNPPFPPIPPIPQVGMSLSFTMKSTNPSQASSTVMLPTATCVSFAFCGVCGAWSTHSMVRGSR